MKRSKEWMLLAGSGLIKNIRKGRAKKKEYLRRQQEAVLRWGKYGELSGKGRNCHQKIIRKSRRRGRKQKMIVVTRCT